MTFKKKLVAAAVMAVFIVSCIFAAGSLSRAKAKNDGTVVPIFMYHEVKPAKTRKDVITPYEFESDLKYLKASGYTAINMTDLINYVDGKGSLPGKPIILTFDDGYYNNYVYAYPLIKKYNVKIVLSIIGKNTDDFTEYPSKNIDYSHVTWLQINEMLDSGLVELQNHTYNLHSISKKRFGCRINEGESLTHYDKVLTDDIEKLQDEILSETGKVPNTFTYPYGKVSKESYPIIKKMGFRASLTCDYGVNIITKDKSVLYGLKRVCRVHGVPIKSGLANVMKTLKYR